MFDVDPFKDLKKLEAETTKKANIKAAQLQKDDIVAAFGAEAYAQILRDLENGADYGDLLQHHKLRARRQHELRNPPPLKGSAAWANWHSLKQNNLLFDPDHRPTSSDVFFGGFLNEDLELRKRNDNWLYWGGQSHLMTVAPTGAGKSSLLLIPNLMQYNGSCFVFDPKGELYQSTSFYRSQIGKVYRLAPFEDNTDAFNPLDAIKSFDDALEFAQILFPSEATGDGAFYEKEARGFLAALMYFISLVGTDENRNMDKVRYFLSLSSKTGTDDEGKPTTSAFDLLISKLANTESLPTPIRRAASLVAEFNAATRTTLLRSLSEKLAVWDSEALTRATHRSDFKFEDMKNETVTVYLTIPFHRIETYSYYVQAMLTFALEAMIAHSQRPKVPVLFILDEFLRLGKFPRFIHALRTHRDAGVRLWFILQSVSDMQDAYPDSWKSFFTATEVKSFFGIRDHFTAQTISEMLGNYTIAYETSSTNTSLSSSMGTDRTNSSNYGNSESINYDAKPLWDANEVQRELSPADKNGTRKALHIIGGVDPVRTIMLPWYIGYRFHCRFGSKDEPVIPSPLMEHLWSKFNEDLFNNELHPPLAIGYLDFSMGRDGYLPFEKDFRGFYDGEFNRIVFIDAIRPLEEAYMQAKDISSPEADKIKDAVFAYYAPLLIHEMAHQYTEQNGGILDDHGSKFFATCQQLHKTNQEKELGFPWSAPIADTVAEWPTKPKLATLKNHIKRIPLGQVSAPNA